MCNYFLFFCCCCSESRLKEQFVELVAFCSGKTSTYVYGKIHNPPRKGNRCTLIRNIPHLIRQFHYNFSGWQFKSHWLKKIIYSKSDRCVVTLIWGKNQFVKFDFLAIKQKQQLKNLLESENKELEKQCNTKNTFLMHHKLT